MEYSALCPEKSEKDTARAVSFFNIVSAFFRGATLVEFCAGDGKAGVQFDGIGLDKIIFVDVKELKSFRKNVADLKTPFELVTSGIEGVVLESGSFVIALHACGILADKVIEKSVNASARFAVIPCCYGQKMKKYNLKKPPDPRKLLYDFEKDYYDAFRMQFIRECGYEAILKTIDQKISPMNNIIIGIPK